MSTVADNRSYLHIYFLQKTATANFRAANACAQPSPVRNFWSWSESSPLTCTSPDWGASRSPHTWTCPKNRWRSGFRTAEWSTKRRERAAAKGLDHITANARPCQPRDARRKRRMTFPYLPPRQRRRTWTCPSPPELSHAFPLKDFGPYDFEYSQKKKRLIHLCSVICK